MADLMIPLSPLVSISHPYQEDVINMADPLPEARRYY